MKISKFQFFLAGIAVALFLQISIDPFCRWCEGVYADAVQIMERLQGRTDKYSWLDEQIYETDKPAKTENNSGMTERRLPQ